MEAISASELTRTVNCKIAGCPNEAAQRTGIYALLCTEHAQQKASGRLRTAPRSATPDADTLEATKRLMQLAKQVDRAKARERLAGAALTKAADERERCEDEYREALRELLDER